MDSLVTCAIVEPPPPFIPFGVPMPSVCRPFFGSFSRKSFLSSHLPLPGLPHHSSQKLEGQCDLKLKRRILLSDEPLEPLVSDVPLGNLIWFVIEVVRGAKQTSPT